MGRQRNRGRCQILKSFLQSCDGQQGQGYQGDKGDGEAPPQACLRYRDTFQPVQPEYGRIRIHGVLQ